MSGSEWRAPACSAEAVLIDNATEIVQRMRTIPLKEETGCAFFVAGVSTDRREDKNAQYFHTWPCSSVLEEGSFRLEHSFLLINHEFYRLGQH